MHANGAPRGVSPRGEVATLATVVLADDHAVVRRGLRTLLDALEGVEVVAEAADVGTALRKVLGYKPDILVLDLNMPGGSSLEAIPRFLETSPRTKILILTMHDEPQLARAALRAGAVGFVVKEAADTELEEAFRAALRGDGYLAPRLGARVAKEPERAPGTPGGLSDRELEVLRLLSLGHTNSEIAARLFVSSRTVESHRAHILGKLGCATRAELFAFVRRHHLLG